MLPEITNLEFINETETTTSMGKSFLFDFEKGDFVLKDGRLVNATEFEALKIWVEKVLKTEKFRFKIYQKTNVDDEYGVTIEDLIIGTNLPISFFESELKREITEGLIKHPMIQGISGMKIDKSKATRTIISFTINLLDNTTFNQEVSF